MNDPDELELFLQSWEPGERLVHASLSQNLNDPFIRKGLFADSTGSASVARTPFLQGQKVMANDELFARAYDFFQDRQEGWAADFKDYVLDRRAGGQVQHLCHLLRKAMGRRQQTAPEFNGSPSHQGLFRDFDRLCYPAHAGRFVINPVADSVPPLFTPTEMAAIFAANNGLIEAFLPCYLDRLGNEGPGSLSDLYVRRGVYMTAVDTVRRELHYLSSYSFTLGPVEQFAQTWTPATPGVGVPSIFSTPLPAVQHRVVAFAPFIERMDLRQLELVVAPRSKRYLFKTMGCMAGSMSSASAEHARAFRRAW
jgi:hypothetical protein